MHGAGLSNGLYMSPKSVMIEIVPDFDSRHAPLTGIFARLAALVKVHHYLYYTKGIDMSTGVHANEMVVAMALFVSQVLHAES